MKDAIARIDKHTQRFHGLSCRDVATAFRGKSIVIIALIVGNKIYGNICFLSVLVPTRPCFDPFWGVINRTLGVATT
jgi:hypothetical protein